MEEPGIVAFELIEDHEKHDELTVHILRSAADIGHAGRRDNDRPKQAGVDFPFGINVRVVPPHHRAGTTRDGTAVLVGLPAIRKALAWGYPRAFAVGKVSRALVVLVIAESMRMNAVGRIGAI